MFHTFFYSASDCRHSHLRIEVYELLKSTFQYIHIPFGLCCRAAWRVCPEMFDPLRVFNVNSNPWRDIGYSWSVIHSGNVEKCSPKYFQEKGFFCPHSIQGIWTPGMLYCLVRLKHHCMSVVGIKGEISTDNLLLIERWKEICDFLPFFFGIHMKI